MSINFFVRIPPNVNAYSARTAYTRQPELNRYFRPNFQFYTRASNQPARFLPQHVVQARYGMYMTLMSMQKQQAAVAQMRAIHLILQAYAGLRGVRTPAAAPQSPAAARPSSTRSGTAASGNASSSSYRSENRSSQTHNSSSTSRNYAKAKSYSPASRTQNANQRSSAEEAKRTNNDKPRQAADSSYSVSDAFKEMGLPVTATAADAKKAYYKAAREHHPDKGGDAEKFKVLNNAYEVIKLHFEKVSP